MAPAPPQVVDHNATPTPPIGGSSALVQACTFSTTDTSPHSPSMSLSDEATGKLRETSGQEVGTGMQAATNHPSGSAHLVPEGPQGHIQCHAEFPEPAPAHGTSLVTATQTGAANSGTPPPSGTSHQQHTQATNPDQASLPWPDWDDVANDEFDMGFIGGCMPQPPGTPPLGSGPSTIDHGQPSVPPIGGNMPQSPQGTPPLGYVSGSPPVGHTQPLANPWPQVSATPLDMVIATGIAKFQHIETAKVVSHDESCCWGTAPNKPPHINVKELFGDRASQCDGRNPEVQSRILQRHPENFKYLCMIVREQLETCTSTHISISVYCRSGKHRSVAAAELIGTILRTLLINVTVYHKSLHWHRRRKCRCSICNKFGSTGEITTSEELLRLFLDA